MHIILFILWL